MPEESREISIISNTKEIVASSNPEKIGQPVTHRRKERIIKAELGEPVSEEGGAYNVIALVWAKAEAEGITIKKDYEYDAEINIDADLFKSCLLNIITNAFQSFENLPENREKTIIVKASSGGDKFILSITDNGGAGISPDNMRSVFELFFTTKETRNRHRACNDKKGYRRAWWEYNTEKHTRFRHRS